MNVTIIEVSSHQAIGGFIILGIVIGVGVTFCYFKKFRGGGGSSKPAIVHNESSDPSIVVI